MRVIPFISFLITISVFLDTIEFSVDYLTEYWNFHALSTEFCDIKRR